ncbi:MAG TPA: ornithine carbamoyltransferase [Streptosporangiaceae bacterium]|nr:ornithine carbamoyltransferase [Streptosporangiaceae bacterium]
MLADTEMTKQRFTELISIAAALKQDKLAGTERAGLTGRTIALLFEKNSTRTRCAFEVAAYDQGGHVTFLGPSGSHVGHEESIPDTARVLGGMYDAIAYRGFDQSVVEQIAEHAGVPVWNALSDQWHPTQMLADLMTMVEHHQGPIEDIAVCYVGDGRNNVARSLLVTGAVAGMDVRIAAPSGLQPPDEVQAAAVDAAKDSRARVLVTDDAAEAVRGAHFVYTDVWLSMGEPDDRWASRIRELTPYRVTSELMAQTGRPDAKFMHCLPSIHNRDTAVGARLFEQFGIDGAEVTEEVFESRHSIVFDQSANKMHSIKGLLVATLAG